jgi:hypothetical protein
MVMGSFLLSILADLITGASKQRIAAAEALGAPPVSPAARGYRSVALWLFLASSVLLLGAALADTIAGARSLSEVFGWSGIGCLQVCVFCGIRYASVNKKRADNRWEIA